MSLDEQGVRAFLGALIAEGVEPAVVNLAVARAMDSPPGRLLPGHEDPRTGAWAREQCVLLERRYGR